MDFIDKQLDNFEKVRESLPEITYIGDPVLRTRTEDVTPSEGQEIGRRLIAVLKKYRELTGVGRGFAAPQIGEAKSVFVLYLEDIQVFINPKIVESSETRNFYRESCLSSGVMLWADIKRNEWIILQWTDEEGMQQKKKFNGIEARIIQHEYDHLQGVVNFDRAEEGSIEFIQENLLQQQLRKE